mgnify:CR=1 FL=1
MFKVFMKKLLGIVVLGLLFCNISFADNDLTGKKLLCQKSKFAETSYLSSAYIFRSDKEILVHHLSESVLGVISDTYYYRANLKEVKIWEKEITFKGGFNINLKLDRSTLKLKRGDFSFQDCTLVVNNELPLDIILRKKLEILKEEQKAKNKI